MQFPNNEKKNPARTVALSGSLIALSLVFGYVERLIPLPVPIPGVKPGLANLVTLTGLFFLSPVQVFIILIARILLSGFLFGNLSAILYSLAGGILSFFVMLFVKQSKKTTGLGVSIAGGTAHNVGQFIVAAMVLNTKALIYYFAPLIIAGALCGALLGVIFLAVSKYLNGKTP